MTTIKAAEYSPNSPAQPLTSLKEGQVALLNRGAANDISQRVKTVVQRHLGYQGTEVFRTTFTKKEITFALKNGSVDENRTLKIENGHWMLSQNSTPTAPLDPALEGEVNALVTEILANIGQASQSNVSDPVQTNHTAAVDAVDDSELVQIKDRLNSLENQLRTNLTLEQSLEVQRQILEQLVGLRAALQKQPHANNAEKDELKRKVKKLQKALAKQEKEFQRLIRDGKGQYESMQVGFEAEKQKFQQSFEAKAQQARELQQKVAHLEKALSQKEAEQKRNLDTFESFKAEKASLEEQLKTARSNLDHTTQQLNAARDKLQKQVEDLQKTLEKKEAELQGFTSDVKAEFERLQNGFVGEKEKFKKALELQQKITDLEKAKSLKAFESFKAEKASLEEQLKTARSNLESSTQQLETLRTQNVDLDSKLQKAEFVDGILDQTVQDLQKLLHEKEQQLDAAAQKAQESKSQILNELEKVKAALEKKELERNKIATAYAESNIKTSRLFTEENEKNERLISKLELAATENNNLQTSVLEKERIAKQWQDEAAVLEKGINYYKNIPAGFQTEIAKLKRQIDYQNLIIDEGSVELKKQLKTAQSNLNTKAQEIQKLQTELQHLQVTAEFLSEENNTLKNKNTSAQQVVATNTTQISSLSEQLETATQMQVIFQNQIKELQADLDNAKLLAAEAMNAYHEVTENESLIQEDLIELKKLVEEKDTELTKTQDDNKDLTDQLEMQTMFNGLALESNKNLQNSLDEKNQQLERTRIEVEEAKIDAEIAVRKAKESQTLTLTELKKVNDARLEAQRKVDDLEGKYSRLTTAHEQVQRELLNLQTQMYDEPESLGQLLKIQEENRS